MTSCGRKATHRNVVIYQKSLKRFKRKLFAVRTRKRIKRPRLYGRTCLDVLYQKYAIDRIVSEDHVE